MLPRHPITPYRTPLFGGDGTKAGDHVVCIGVTKEVAWQRRLGRALQMAAGASDTSGMENYEQLHVYATEADYRRIRADASEHVARLGRSLVYPVAGSANAKTSADLSVAAEEYDWLRLYFDEVIWPEAQVVQAHVETCRAERSVDVHTIDGDQPTADVELATRCVISRVLS